MVVVGAAGASSVRRYQGLLCAGHSQFQPSLQRTHCRKHLNPSVTGGHLWENLHKKGQERVEDLRMELRYDFCAENCLAMDVLGVWEAGRQG